LENIASGWQQCLHRVIIDIFLVNFLAREFKAFACWQLEVPARAQCGEIPEAVFGWPARTREKKSK
jgi:hypothetical protein